MSHSLLRTSKSLKVSGSAQSSSKELIWHEFEVGGPKSGNHNSVGPDSGSPTFGGFFNS